MSGILGQNSGTQRRLAVPPGLMGWARVYGGGARDAREKLRYDLDYVQPMSLLLDIKLMLLAVCNTRVVRWDKEGHIAGQDASTSES